MPTTRWRSLPEDLDRPLEQELDLTDPPVPERRRRALLGASVLAVPVLAVVVSLGVPGTEAAPHPSAQVAPAPVDVGVFGATGVAPGAWTPPAVPSVPTAAGPVDATGIPARVLQAYRGAEGALGTSEPGCRLPWSLVAAIGRVESDHAGAGAVDIDGRTLTPIRGPRLDGTGGHPFLVDTDGGRLDGDPGVDLAVGPMQFLPSSWTIYGADGDGNGAADPADVDDATVGSGRHLCAGGADLSDPGQRAAAVFAYNRSDTYVAQVLAVEAAYAAGAPAPALPAPASAPGVPGVPTEPGVPGVPTEPAVLAIEPVAPAAPAPSTVAPTATGATQAPASSRPSTGPVAPATSTAPPTTSTTPPAPTTTPTAPTPDDATPSPLFGAP